MNLDHIGNHVRTKRTIRRNAVAAALLAGLALAAPTASHAQTPSVDTINTLVSAGSSEMRATAQGSVLFAAKCLPHSGSGPLPVQTMVASFLIGPDWSPAEPLVVGSNPNLFQYAAEWINYDSQQWLGYTDSLDSFFWTSLRNLQPVGMKMRTDAIVLFDQFTPAVTAGLTRFFNGCDAMGGQNPNNVGETPPPANNQGGTGDGDLAGAVAIGALAVGGAIIANEIVDQFFTEAPAPDAPGGQGARTTVTIGSVTANSTTLGFGGDEIFLLFSDGTRFPASGDSYQEIDDGQVWRPNASATTSGGISVDLREWDSFNASDVIGNLAIEANRAPGRYTATLRGDGGDYLIEYSVARSGGQTPNAGSTPVQPQPADQPASNRVWAAHGGNESITVTDCRDDCEEDIGILIQCQGLGQPALVDVPWAATETGPAGAVRPLSIVVGHQAYVFSATLGNYGMVGHVPSFIIAPNDPVIEALQGGSAAQIVFEGRSTTLGLKGSRSALDVFKAHCGWNGVAQAPTVQQPVQQDTQPYWFASQYTDFSTGQARTSLTFGIPETDATGFFAACTPGGNNTVIPVDLIVDFANQPAGASVPVYIQTSSYTAQYQGRVFISSSEWAGVRIGVSPSDPIWQAMQKEPQLISYGVGGAQQGLSTLTGVAQAVPQFLASCFGGPGSNGQQPVQQTQPVQQPIQQQVVQPVQQPIQQQVTQPIQQQQVTQPIQQQQVTQPVQQQGGLAGGMDFTCDDGSRLVVNLVAAGTVSVANVTRNGTLVTLVEVPTAVGKKYSNGEATLNVSGMTAQYLAQGASLFCQAN